MHTLNQIKRKNVALATPRPWNEVPLTEIIALMVFPFHLQMYFYLFILWHVRLKLE
jgi:hypothetical protein